MNVIALILSFLLGAIIAFVFGFHVGWDAKRKSIRANLEERERELQNDIAATNEIEDVVTHLRMLKRLQFENEQPLRLH
jgi:hypothetical protein